MSWRLPAVGALMLLASQAWAQGTISDPPATFTRPVVLSQHWLWLPSVTLLPYECTVH